MKLFNSDKAPLPAGHYSQAVIQGGMVYVSGQLPVVPGTNEKITGEIEDQAKQALSNLKTVLEEAGSGIDKVIKTTVYVSDISLWSRVNAIYADFFGSHRPARSVVPTGELHYGFLIEIDAIAAI
ncbi:MAG: Rid family detoxifying hydrolase [Spirochaetia bacterium]|jgi:2-iminobutanoate/2-iminopropanoate deaminase|nr:Rid family detoxifying hydrolase [Spirochaetia bacterium]